MYTPGHNWILLRAYTVLLLTITIAENLRFSFWRTDPLVRASLLVIDWRVRESSHVGHLAPTPLNCAYCNALLFSNWPVHQKLNHVSSVQFSSVTSFCTRLCAATEWTTAYMSALTRWRHFCSSGDGFHPRALQIVTAGAWMSAITSQYSWLDVGHSVSVSVCRLFERATGYETIGSA